MQLTEAATLDRKSGEVEGFAVLRTRPGNVFRPNSGKQEFLCAQVLDAVPEFGRLFKLKLLFTF
jgi:hypothetical protein